MANELLQPGTPAPDFELPVGPGETVKLSDYRGQPVVLVFYPADWSSVCSDQVSLYNNMLDMFAEHDAQLLGISVDNFFSHQAFAEDRGLEFPLLADFEPKGEVSRKYGAYNTDYGQSQRALFVIDSDGVIRWSYLSPMGENPGADGILNALDDLDES
ncbi:MAG: peroxiredoxin [Chloroflexi bacterium]|nr:peroxiredoxin [Chloroflexota bacterium]